MLKLFVLLLLFTSLSARVERADFILVENPAGLTLLNKYKQKLSEREALKLPAFALFKIEEEKLELQAVGDLYTKVSYRSDTYYILEKKQGLSNSISGRVKRFNNKQYFNDEVKSLAANKLFFRLPFSQKKEAFVKNVVIQRIFKDVSEFYCYVPDLGVYCWVKFPEWQKGKTWAEKSFLPKKHVDVKNVVLEKCRLKASSFNRLFSSIYTHLNKEKNLKLESPRWSIQEKGNKIICSFSNIGENLKYSYADMLKDFTDIALIYGYNAEETESGVILSK